MNKLYTTYLVLGISVISFSTSAMENGAQALEQKKDHHSTWVIQPIGGTIQLKEYLKQDFYHFYNINPNATIEKVIHFMPVDTNDQTNTIYQFLKYGMKPAIPDNIFTEENQSYTISHNNHKIKLVSDRLYDKNSFVSQKKHW